MPASKSVRDQLQRLLASLPFGGSGAPGERRRWFHRGAHLVTLDEKEAAQYEKVAELLLEEFAPTGGISESTITTLLNDAAFETWSPLSLDRRGRAEFAAARVLEVLEGDIKVWRVHFPISGMYAECLPLTLGPVTFHPPSESLTSMVLAAGGPSSHGLSARIREFARHDIERHFGGHSWASVSVEALQRDPEAATQLALAELELTLDVVNFYADVFRPREYRARVEERWRATDGVRVSCPVMDGTEATGVAWSRAGPLDEVWLPPIDSSEARDVGLTRAHALLSARSRTQMDKRVLASLRWAGRGTAAERIPDKIMSFVMALEALIGGPAKTVKLAQKLESRTAQLLSNDNSASRHDPQLARLYDLRSRLVHTGWADVTDDDAFTARYYAKESAVKVMVTEPFASFATDADFDGWFAPLPERESGKA